ncbi:hypothetical protein [Vibrio sp. CK2-1]|uniref:hypothetical protein n=1 Tax=Vibrio sp. CK2-1 TaxID=2912249 RepID=UPI001F3DEE60|nr:hypothetical protein [Vibrio sp. CK2-1]MCF7353429.1 hypothetical protein [Vibrio sp. CK2-1]
MSETLKKSIALPKPQYIDGITGTIVAHEKRPVGKYFSGQTIDQSNELTSIVNKFIFHNSADSAFYSWYLFLYVPGPDARHLPGKASLNPLETYFLLNTLKLARSKMEALSSVEFDGEYKKDIDCAISNPKLSVTAKDNVIKLEFWLTSGGKYMYARKYTLAQVVQIITAIESSFEIGENLAVNLQLLSD